MKTAQQKTEINANFIQEWQPFDKLNKKVERALVRHFMNNSYQFQPSHDPNSKKPFQVYTFAQIGEILGLAYTSGSSCAALWVCNSGYLWATPTHHFIGFAINTDNEVIGIAWDFEENEIYIPI